MIADGTLAIVEHRQEIADQASRVEALWWAVVGQVVVWELMPVASVAEGPVGLS